VLNRKSKLSLFHKISLSGSGCFLVLYKKPIAWAVLSQKNFKGWAVFNLMSEMKAFPPEVVSKSSPAKDQRDRKAGKKRLTVPPETGGINIHTSGVSRIKRFSPAHLSRWSLAGEVGFEGGWG
jgi:hypothetical protein